MSSPAFSAHALPRPTNVLRSLFHVGSGFAAATMIHLVPDRLGLTVLAATMALAAWTMETMRRRDDGVNETLMRVFGPIAHSHERHHVNSATWYTTALVLLAALADPVASVVAVMVLAVADPVAALVGRRFGTIRLRQNRSLEGTLAFFGAGTVVSWLALLVAPVAADVDHRLLLALLAGAVGAVAELFATRVDDNLAIPVTVGAALTLALL